MDAQYLLETDVNGTGLELGLGLLSQQSLAGETASWWSYSLASTRTLVKTPFKKYQAWWHGLETPKFRKKKTANVWGSLARQPSQHGKLKLMREPVSKRQNGELLRNNIQGCLLPPTYTHTYTHMHLHTYMLTDLLPQLLNQGWPQGLFCSTQQ